MPDDEETQHEWASGTSTPYPRRGSREQLPELGSRAIKAGFNRLLADPQNHRSVGLAHFVDAAKEQYLAQTLRQLVDRPTNPGEIGRAHVRTPVTNAHLVCCLLLEHTVYCIYKLDAP